MEVARVIDQLYREYSGKLIVSLVAYFGLNNLKSAEDLVQETFLSAIQNWEMKGLPQQPSAWLYKTAKNKAINWLKQTKQNDQKTSVFESSVVDEAYNIDQLFLEHEIQDNQLRLLFAYCHPDFAPRTQVIITLKTIAGFKTEEIAHGLGMNYEAVKKTLTRTRKQIKERRLQLKVPFLLQSRKRLANVHIVLYLLFNEGYNATSGKALIKKELCLEAMRLTQSLLDHPTISNDDTHALLALMLFNTARFEARMNSKGVIIDLEMQNRELWDNQLIKLGYFHLKKAQINNKLSRYHLEAGIASLHCATTDFSKTNWRAILGLYNHLYEIHPSPFVFLNRCIALAYSGDVEEAIQGLLKIDDNYFKNYHLYFLTLAKLHSRIGQNLKAKEYYSNALQLTRIQAEQEYIMDCINGLER